MMHRSWAVIDRLSDLLQAVGIAPTPAALVGAFAFSLLLWALILLPWWL
jgi:hypothetical protein